MCCFRWCGRQLCLRNMPISGVDLTPRTTAVYASDPALPRRPQDSLPPCLLGFGRTRLALASSYRLLLSHPAYGSHLGCLTAGLAAFRTRSGACDTLSRRCVRHVRHRFAFSLASALRSTASAADRPALFGGFVATMAESDFSCPCIIGFGSSPSRCGPVGSAACVAGHEISQVPTPSFRT